eukprot:TRINITY_DN21367_c0_g1_i2.p1 TRINITY_DN21367_c0_g1~~TRINITY_DN21367_c0_g1_i2.p1  ORF type:complete len:186 (-),score=30.40 TRINITY_DN21367_c0_g1_i2:116-673(-)
MLYRSMLKCMGVAAGMVMADFDKNLDGAKAAAVRSATSRSTFKSLLREELSSGIHKPGNAQTCELDEASGAMKMQWMLRGMEFFFTYIQLLLRGDKKAAVNAYEQTLRRFHSWIVALGAKSAVLAMPNRSAVCGLKQLCPSVTDDDERATIIAREGAEVAEVGLLLVSRMVDISREMQLWQDIKV